MNDHLSGRNPEVMTVSWHISTFTAEDAATCVEAGPVAGTELIAVRHSRSPDGPIITYTVGEWTAFVAGVKAGEFDY